MPENPSNLQNEKLDGATADDSDLPEVSLEFIKSDINTLYVNNAQFAISPWDLRIDLNELQGVQEKKILVKSLVVVNMSWQFAKTFSIIMKQQVEKYEEQFGEIKAGPTARLQTKK